MRNFEKTLEQLTEYIQAYDDVSMEDGDALSYLLKKITTSVFYLDLERVKYKKGYERKIYELTVDKKVTVNRAVNIAEVEYPEVYLLRRVIDSANRVSDAIRTNISFLKSEKRNSASN